jgi:hypothetical protein
MRLDRAQLRSQGRRTSRGFHYDVRSCLRLSPLNLSVKRRYRVLCIPKTVFQRFIVENRVQ